MVRRKVSSACFVALSMAVCSMSAYAAVAAPPTTDDPFRVFIPYLKPGFEFSLGAVWLKPGASNLNYVILNKELPAQSPTWEEQELQPTFRTGFELGVRYVLPAIGKDVRMNWTHLQSDTHETTRADNVNFFLGPDWEIGPDGIPIRSVYGKVKFTYDVVNLDAGQYVNFGQDLRMRFFAGISAGWLNQEVIATMQGTSPEPFPGPFSMQQEVESDFTGIGPRFGMSAEYFAPNGIGVIGEAGMSALIGGMRSITNYVSSSVFLSEFFDQTRNFQNIKDQTVYQVVPGFDAKLGLNYKYPFNYGMVTLAAGYQAAVYVNAISQYVPASVVVPFELGGVFVSTMSHTLSNYSVHGPFLNLAVSIA